jgi:lysozyme
LALAVRTAVRTRLLIVAASLIAARAEALPGAASAGHDSGPSTAESTVCAAGSIVRGVDVSYYQGTIDWNAAKGDGIAFAFIRVSDGTGFYDPQFDANWANAKSAGVIRGAYQFFRPNQDAVAQADLMLAHMTLEPTDLPPVLDVEVDGGQSSATIIAGIHAWIDHVHAATGRTPIIYTAHYFWGASVGTSEFAAAGVPLWVANYGPSCPNLPDQWSAWQFWQDADNGTVAGISGGVDTDQWNGTLGDLTSWINPSPVCGDGFCTGGETNADCPSDCPVCENVPADGRIIDDTDLCFTAGGPAPGIRRVSDAGYGGNLTWTHTTDLATAENFGQWSFTFDAAGTYRVEVYTAAAYAQSKMAHYVVAHGGTSDTVTIDQTAVDGWQTIGEYSFAQGGAQSLRVDDNTGEAESTNTQLVFDAVRLTRIDAPPIDPPPGNGLTVASYDPPSGDGGMTGGCSVGGHRHAGAQAMILVMGALVIVVVRRRRARA